MVPGMEVLGLRSLAQVVAELKGAEVPEAPPVAPMSGQRLLSWRGQDRQEEVDLADLRGHARRPLRRRGGRRGRSPPDAGGAQGVGQDLPRRADPRHPARPRQRGGARAHRDPLAGRRARAGRRPAGATAVLRTAPHASKASLLGGGPARCGPARSAGPTAACSSSTSSRCSPSTSSRRCASRSRVARSPSPAARSPRPSRHGGWSSSPPTRAPAATIAPSQGQNRCTCQERIAATTDASCRARSPTGSTSRATSSRSSATRAGPLRSTSRPAEVRARVAAARARQAARFAGRGWRLNGQVPGPVLAREWPLPEAAAHARRPSSTTAG